MTPIILVVLIVVLVIVLMQLFKKQAASAPAAPSGPDLANLKVTDARTGDVLSVSGAGDNLTDLDFTVDRSTRCQGGAHYWTELSGPYRERRVTLRVAGDEEIEAAIQSDPRKLTIEDLGLAEEDLASMDERQNTADNFPFDGKSWLYRRSREATAARDGYTQAAKFYYWEFQEQGGPGLLLIRKAEGEPFAVTLYSTIPAQNVTVYRGAP